MKIDGIWISALSATQNVNKAKQAEIKKPMGKDGLLVSDKANVFKALLQKAQEIPAVREEKVSELKAQISNGNYKVDVSKVAQIILSEE